MLVIDRAAASSPADPSAVSRWGQQQRIFVSSVMVGFDAERAAAAAAIEAIGAKPVMFERFGGRDADPRVAYLDEVASSTVFVGLLGSRYGTPQANRFSASHEEFVAADSRAIRLSMWVDSTAEMEGPQQSFLDSVRSLHVTGSFNSPKDLESSLHRRLSELAAEELCPWCKFGDVVFRASSVEISADVATVLLSTDDDALIDLLTNRSYQQQFLTTPRSVFRASLESSRLKSETSRGGELELKFSVSSVPPPTRFSFNGASWSDQTEMCVRSALLDQAPQQEGFGQFGSALELPPIGDQLEVSEESVRPISKLLLNEALVVNRGIVRVTQLDFGPRRADGRRVRVRWNDQTDGNSEWSTHEVAGTITPAPKKS